MSTAPDVPAPPPLPAEQIHPAESATAASSRAKLRSGSWKAAKVLAQLVAGGIITLIVGLISGYVQIGAQNQQSMSEQQYELWQRLQSESYGEATLILQVYADAQGCTDFKTAGWSQCAKLSPSYNSWVEMADQVATTASNIDDAQARRLSMDLVDLSNTVVSANSVTSAHAAKGTIWHTYELLDGRLGALIRSS